MTPLERLSDETLQTELCEAFQRLVDGFIIDPEFEYEIRDVNVLERTPAYVSDIKYEIIFGW